MKQIFIYLLLGSLNIIGNAQTSICSSNFNETFEGYSLGSSFVNQVRQSGNICWSTWDCNNYINNPQDVQIKNGSPNGNYINFYALYSNGGPDDIVRYLGNKTSGKYTLTFDLRVKSGKCAIFSLLHNFICNDPNNSDYAFTIKYASGYVYVQIGQSTYYQNLTTYLSNSWFTVKLVFDLDTKQIYFTPTTKYSYTYSWAFDASSTPYRNNSLGAIDFWTHSNADYDIDNFQFSSQSNQMETFDANPRYISINNGCDPSTFCVHISSNTSWIVNAPTWLNIAPLSGNGNTDICGTFGANPSSMSRTATINFTYGPNNLQGNQVIVTQSGCAQPNYCSFDPPSITFSPNGSSQSATILSNGSWMLTNLPSWIHISTNDSKGSNTKNINLTVDPNNSGTARCDNVTYYCGSNGPSFNLYVCQNSLIENFNTNCTVINTKCDAIDIQCTFTSTTKWVTIDKPSWVDINPLNGNPPSTPVKISIKQNSTQSSRNGNIIISYGSGLVFTIPVSQDPCQINNYCYFDPSFLSVDETAKSYNVSIV
ncbi:MAG: BACON domain-containing carbohydrate-binding protein, partial [Saprospiraceae bacterium]